MMGSGSLAAGTWCFDESKAPQNTHILIAFKYSDYSYTRILHYIVSYQDSGIWFNAHTGEEISEEFKFRAWVEINLPKEGDADHNGVARRKKKS